MFFMWFGSYTIPAQDPIFFTDMFMVDTVVAFRHLVVFIEPPVSISMAPPPLARGVVPFAFESRGDAVGGERPEVFLQSGWLAASNCILR